MGLGGTGWELGESGVGKGPGGSGRVLGGEQRTGMEPGGTGWVLGGGRGLGWVLAGQERGGDGLHDKADGRAGWWRRHNVEIFA